MSELQPGWMIARTLRQRLPDGIVMRMPLDPPIVIGRPPEAVLAQLEKGEEDDD